MNRFLEYIERYKFAILGTVLFHVVFFMTTNFVTVQRPYKLEEPITEVEIDADAIELDEAMLEMLNQQNEMANQEIMNMAADANDKRERSYENFSTQALDEQVENEARQLEQQYFDELAKTHPESGNGGIEEKPKEDLKKNPNEKPDKTITKPTSIDGTGSNAYAGQVMVSFSLKDRKANAMEIPGYTCNGSGTVVIDIKVDKAGDVKSAEFNAGLSSGATECMIEKAKRYAKRARFNYADSGENMANGTITYKFIGQ